MVARTSSSFRFRHPPPRRTNSATRHSARVCALTGAINGYDHVKVTGGRLAIHENRKLEKEIRKVSIIEFDEIWFKGKNIVTFDDVITRGITWATYCRPIGDFSTRSQWHLLGKDPLQSKNKLTI